MPFDNNQRLKLEKLNELTPADCQALLYDCDGTLADNMQNHKESYVKTALEYGFELDPALIDELAGWPTTQVVAEMSRRYNVPLDIAAFARRKGQIFNEHIEDTQPISFVVEHLKQHAEKYRIGIVSGGRRQTVEKTLTVLGIRHLIDFIVCAGETEKGKPFPDPFLKAADALAVTPGACLVLEDGKAGTDAAAAAGMRWVRVDKI